jgi:hypothetical protein
LFCWSLELGIHFLYFPLIKLFLRQEWSPSLFCLPIAPFGTV